MVRDTSIAAYHQLLATGKLSERRKSVLLTVMEHGPMTSNECFDTMASKGGMRLRFDSNTRARFTELREMGLLAEVGRRVCRVTAQTVILWDINPQVPPSIPKLERKVSLAERVSSLESKVAELLGAA